MWDWAAGEIAWMQSIEAVRSPFGNLLASALNYLADIPGYLILAPIVYWLNRRRGGLRALVGLLLCMMVNVLVKDWVGEPRPFDIAPLAPLFHPKDFSFPSGHAQISLFFWASLLTLYPRRFLYGAVPLLLAALGASRVYCGVHFPHDVLGGWGLGAGLYLIFFHTRWVRPIPGWVAAGALLGLAWLDPNPSVLSLAGTLLGIQLGVGLMGTDVGEPTRPWMVIPGVVGVVAIYAGLFFLQGHLTTAWLRTLVVVTGFVGLGLWLTAGYEALQKSNAPWKRVAV